MRDGLQRNALHAAADRVASKALAQALRSGVGLHHGNLEPQDRAAVEKLFLDRALPVFPQPKILLTCKLIRLHPDPAVSPSFDGLSDAATCCPVVPGDQGLHAVVSP